MSQKDTLKKLLDKHKAKVFYQNEAGMVCLRRDCMYQWFGYDCVARRWTFSGSTLTKGRGVSKHYHIAH